MEFSYQIIKKPKKRNASITISADNSVKICVPYFLSNSQIENLIAKKRSWIIKKLKENFENKTKFIPKNFVTGEQFSFLGQSLELSIIFGSASKVYNAGNLLKVETNIFIKSHIKKLIEKWYVAEAKKIFAVRTCHYSEIIYNINSRKPEGLFDFLFLNTAKKDKLFYNRIAVKNLKSRWGSCSGKKNINYNWKLVLAPLEVLDYVVVHELCHLVYLNHSLKFWHLVEKAIPNYSLCRKWLKANGCILNF